MTSLRDTTRTDSPGARSWGTFPSTTTLPNTEFGPVTARLFPGDMAVVSGSLYRCTDATIGSATWEKIPELADISGAGDVTGPGSSTDNAIVRWDGTDGTAIQDSGCIIDDNNFVFIPKDIYVGTDGVQEAREVRFFGESGASSGISSTATAGQLQLNVTSSFDTKYLLLAHNAGSPAVVPNIDSTWDIGSNSLRLKTAYLDALVATDTVSVGAASDNTARITLGSANYLDVEADYFRYEPRTGAVGVDSYLRSQSGASAESTVADGNPAGDLYIEAGDGTAGGAAGPTDGGDGGTLYLRAGAGGASVGEAVTDGQGGDVIMDAGAGGGGSTTDGVITIGATSAYSVTIGRADGALGFFGATPVVRPDAYTPTNVTPDRSFDADTVTTAELADIVGTMIADLQNLGIYQ